MLLAAAGCAPPPEIEYRGQKVRLSRSYADYDEYKNDPENIHPSERARVQFLVESAPVAASYPDEVTLMRTLAALSFPGYGGGIVAGSLQPEGTSLLAYAVEIPGSERSRYLLFETPGGPFTLLDDFTEATLGQTGSVRAEGPEWVYRGSDGTVWFRRKREGEE
jgi:hypothetical protein